MTTFSTLPYAACVLPSLMATRCDACLRDADESGAPLTPCAKCGVVHYCCAACRRTNAVQHAHECGALAGKRKSNKLTSLRAACEVGEIGRFGGLLLAARCLWRRHESDGSDPTHDLLFERMQLGTTTDDDVQLGELATQTPGLVPPGTGAQRIAELLAALRLNYISITKGRSMGIVGVGCYPYGALLNHSCAPNCVLAFAGGATLQVRAARAIGRGEELVHSYTELTTPTRLRQSMLQRSYGFACDCTRCAGVVYEGEDVDFAMEAVTGGAEGEDVGVASEESVDALMQLSEAQLARAEQATDGKKAMRLTRLALTTRRTHCHWGSLLRYHAESACFEMAMRLGDKATAKECCAHQLAFLEMALGHVPWHPSLSLERYTLGELEAGLGNEARGRALLDAALCALTITHGEAHELTRLVATRRAAMAPAQADVRYMELD